MTGSATQCIERYLELTNQTRKILKKVQTPCIDAHLLPPEDFETKGQLDKDCSKAVLKALYLAIIGRPDILWTVISLAREVTKWNVACDKRLFRFICYLYATENYVMTSYVGDTADKCKLALFCDASFAGDLKDSKSTSMHSGTTHLLPYFMDSKETGRGFTFIVRGRNNCARGRDENGRLTSS